MVSDEALIAIGTHYPDISELVRAEMIRTAEQNPQATREDFIADIARHLAAQLAPEVPDHQEHVDCADACGLDVTHDGACLDRPGGRVVCDDDNHTRTEDGDPAQVCWAVSVYITDAPDQGPYDSEEHAVLDMTQIGVGRDQYRLVWRDRASEDE